MSIYGGETAMRETVTNTDIQSLLMEWARWRYSGHGADIGYPAQSAFVRVMKPAGYRVSGTPLIDDEMAGMVDLAVSRLRQRCINMEGDHRYEAITDCYLLGKTDSFIAKRLHCDRRTIQSARKAAESWVDSHLVSSIME